MVTEDKTAQLLSLIGVQPEDLDWTKLSSQTVPTPLIRKLSNVVTEPRWTAVVASGFPALISAVLEDAYRNQYEKGNDGGKSTFKFNIIVTVSKLIRTYPSALQFAETFFPRLGSPLTCLSTLVNTSYPTLSKKRRLQRTEYTIEDARLFLEAILILVKVLPKFLTQDWPLKSFLILPTSLDKKLTWYALECIGLLLILKENELEQMKIECGIDTEIDLEYGMEFQSRFESVGEQRIGSVGVKVPDKGIVHFPGALVSIGGTLFKCGGTRKCSSVAGMSRCSKVVPLSSTVSYLREIMMSLSSRTPICLSGPIGCGKSTLIKYTGEMFGRNGYPGLITIQMSDQVDARLLLGSYHSTDLPGQFLWKPGPLTKAVLKGHWIVLEDVDSAPPDVMALVDGLVDSNRLSVPGYGEISNVHPEFRLFSTYRTQVGRRNVRLGKHWKKIRLESMSSAEMKMLIADRFTHLSSLGDKLVRIFEAVSTFQSDLSGRHGRGVSLRDFLKFCHRISPSLDLTQTSAAIGIFQEACALFINSFPSPETRQEIAEVIGTELNLLRAKAEYFCTTYKPHINICTNSSILTAGKYSISIFSPHFSYKRNNLGVFSLTKKSCRLVETLVGNVINGEPVLLIGETGVGKTSCVQFLARVLEQKLIVVNLNRQSDSGDLLGGYKPVELRHIFRPIREQFEALFTSSFDSDANSKFLGHIMTCYGNRRWRDLVRLMIHVQKVALRKVKNEGKPDDVVERWRSLGHQLARLEIQIWTGEESPFAFSFIEGTLITAIKNGYWILLDEINLATPEMLQCLSGILEESAGIHLWEKGDESPIERHPNFHLFAAMNPSTDVGKKDLPLGLRNRFTEVYVEELTERMELQVLVSDYLKEMALSSIQIESLVQFYLTVKSLSESTLVDGTGKRPHFSLRTLCRALTISSLNLYGSATRSLYESFSLSFLTQLDYSSHPLVQNLVAKHIFGKAEVGAILGQDLPCPKSGKHVKIEGYWIPCGDDEPREDEKYILTPSIRRNLKDVVRIISAGKLPVLIQGETSVGKTSLVQYVAQISGNRCYRINNHQHTDLQEYIGSYQSDPYGKLVFTQGILVSAMRRGEWVILDELNLAPSEVLEALNRLLDDNRQLFITETGQTVEAHERFMLFATQNPPGLYGGRKILSRAFRNRFVELHFDEIPSAELETILHHRCNVPQSYSKKIIGVLRELQMRRKASAALEGKHGFATLRDLFRWAERYRLSEDQPSRFYDWDQHLADEGYLVLAGKVRKAAEAEVIIEVIQKHLKRTVDPNQLFSLHDKTSTVTRPLLEILTKANVPQFGHIVWTFQMRRLAVLISSSLKFKEPILLVGETGGGKTTVVELLSKIYGHQLFSMNCHMHSESSDFVGGLRPVRDHRGKDSRLFEWVDGLLVEAMESGGMFLADEISLADDSVLERINSVLEPERTLLLAEKGDASPKLVVAHEQFQFIGTMNPGGDYGKKELSPALRNRLTEIWCEVSSDPEDISAIVEHNLVPALKSRNIPSIMIGFVGWLKKNQLGTRCTLSIRDYLSWTEFLNRVVVDEVKMGLAAAVMHGACLTFLDGLGSGTTATENLGVSREVKCQALEFLEGQTAHLRNPPDMETLPGDVVVTNTKDVLGVGPFFVRKCDDKDSFLKSVQNTHDDFNLEAPTTSQNALRVLRGMTLKKPILLEGSPGVGKTALVTALGSACRRKVVRINLSEQTDISDLFGADLPVENGVGGEFEWRDGPLLQALKSDSWVLLDELNLASQSVLEGLNACLDHRGQVYVPELNRTFEIGRTGGTRIFGCQNPVRQGGARKGLPKSFLNRFTQVFMDPLSVVDLEWIMRSTLGTLPGRCIGTMATVGAVVMKSVETGLLGGKGGPWDFNLRDLIRWGKLVEVKGHQVEDDDIGVFVDFVFAQRLRTRTDREKVLELYAGVAGIEVKRVRRCGTSGFRLTRSHFECGLGSVARVSEKGDGGDRLIGLQSQFPALEALTLSLEMGWMPILVGPTNAGKTSIIQLLGDMTGRDVKVMSVSPEMDTMELLGGFEQADLYRKIEETVGQLRKKLEPVVKSIVKKVNLSLEESQVIDFWSSLHSLPPLISGELLSQEEEVKRIQDRLRVLEEGVRKVKFEIPWFDGKLEEIRRQLRSGLRNGAFEWVDSGLVKAVREGSWVVIDGANRCTPAVLDRLNPLMESNGTLILSERGTIDGNIIQIKPHPHFRLILTMDPAFGEISRAMRNRGVEIYMPGLCEEGIQNGSDVHLTPGDDGVNWNDLSALCKAQGWINTGVIKDLERLHGQIYEIMAPSQGISDRPHVSELTEVIERFSLELLHGSEFVVGLKNALRSVYLGNLELDLKPNVESLIQNFTLGQNSEDFGDIFPLRACRRDFLNSKLYRVGRCAQIVEMSLETPSIVRKLERIRGSVKDMALLRNLLIVVPFMRICADDAQALEAVTTLKFPWGGFKFAKFLENDLEDEKPWDPWTWTNNGRKCSTVVALDTVRTSLLLYGEVFKNTTDNSRWAVGTVGDASRTVALGRAIEKSELYGKFWRLLDSFDGILNRALTRRREGGSPATLWRSGMTTWLWRTRLFALASSESKLGSKLDSDHAPLILLVEWIGEEVVGFVTELDAGVGAELRAGVGAILAEVEHVGGRSPTLEAARRMRIAANKKPFAVGPKEAVILEEILTLILDGWSLSSRIKMDRLTRFLMSIEGCESAQILNRSLDSVRTEDLVKVREAMEKVKSGDFEEGNEELEGIQKNVKGLEEFVRIEAHAYNSAFVSPLIPAPPSQNWSGFTAYLNWEEEERWRRHFVQGPNYDSLGLVPSIPVLVANVIVNEVGKYRVATLGSRRVLAVSLESVQKVVNHKVTSEATIDQDILTRLGQRALDVFERLGGNEELRKRFGIVQIGTLEQRFVTQGLLLLELGLEAMTTASHLPTVDPAVESKILAKYLEEEIGLFKTWIGAERLYESVSTGVDIVEADSTARHPFVSESLTHLHFLKEKLIKTRDYEAFRPQPPNYDEIRQNLNQFMSSFTGSEAMLRFKERLSSGEGLNEAELESGLTSCAIWIDSLRNFVKKLFEFYWYWDITAGFLVASTQVANGLGLIGCGLNRTKVPKDCKERLELRDLVQFPLRFKGMEGKVDGSRRKESVIRFWNQVVTEGYAKAGTMVIIHELSRTVARIWNRHEEEKRKAKELEDAMYVFKVKSEEEEERMELSERFPSYGEDLIDLEVQNTLEYGTDSKRKLGSEKKKKDENMLSTEEISLFLQVHHEVVSRVKTHWIASTVKGDVAADFLSPYLIRFESVCVKFKDMYKYLGKEEENEYLVGASLAIEALKTGFPSRILTVGRKKLYDFYHDPNIEEVWKLSPILTGLTTRVRELLVEWPQHPSLIKILEVVERMESFPSTSPVMRYLTCVELLLATAQEWESCAHRGVSIALYLTEITELIITWRKLELQCWKNLLEITFEREQSEGHKWFFHVYSSVMEILDSNSSSQVKPADFLRSLHHFLESSSLGQFQTRLDYLFDMHCHVVSLDQAGVPVPPYLLPYIWNTFKYYHQFRDGVATNLTSLKAPIEKKMRDFVKISRWNDANFWALKDSVHKNQRMLNKLVRDWKKVMGTPVTSVVVSDLSLDRPGGPVGKKRRVSILKPGAYLTPSKDWEQTLGSKVGETFGVKRLGRLRKIFKKTQTVLKPIFGLEGICCKRNVEGLEELSGRIIEDVHALQGIEVSEKCGDARRKSLHSIHFRKRTALADLFKVLQQLNLSYRRGLVELARDDMDQRNFQRPPVDISAGLESLGLELTGDQDLVKSWDGCESYFQRCLARWAVMTKAFESPSKELGPRIIERCKGFTVDLLKTAAAQKDLIAEFNENLWNFRALTEHNYAQGQNRSEFEAVHGFAAEIEYESRQLKLLAESVQVPDIVEKVQTILDLSEEVKDSLKIYVDSVSLPYLTQKRMEGRVDLEHCMETLKEIGNRFGSLTSDTVLGRAFSKVRSTVEEFVNKTSFQERDEVELSESVLKAKFGRTVKLVLERMLLSIQNMEKLTQARKEVGDEEEHGTNVKEMWIEELKGFELKKMVKWIALLIGIMQTENCTEYFSIFAKLSPMFHQFSLCAQFWLTASVQFHRSTCKLLSVLMGIFTTLGSKGFCLPSDYEEDAVAESEDMDTAAGMGLGEGDTTDDAQDVSDRLESEDQLEDTLKQGEAPPEANKEMKDDEKGVEMSDDFEGKQQESEKREGEEDKDEESGSEEEETELDKQMGEVDDLDAEKLDDQMWGGSSDEDDEDLEEKDEESGKGSNRQAEPEMRAKDPGLEPEPELESDPNEEKPGEEPKSKEFNEQDEELNDNQVDPYHGQHGPEEPPEEMDLPEDLNLDGGDQGKEDVEEENPFDLDATKEQEEITEVPEIQPEDEEPKPEQNGDGEGEVSEDEDPEASKGVDVEKRKFDEVEPEEEEKEPEVEEGEGEMGIEGESTEDKEEVQDEKMDETEAGSEGKNEEKAEPSESHDGSKDQTVGKEGAKGERMEESMDEKTEDERSKKDQTATGQSESQDGTGHEGRSVQEDKNHRSQSEHKEQNASRKPGDTDQNRSLAPDQKFPEQGAVHRLKTMDRPEESAQAEDSAQPEEDAGNAGLNAELYQHVRDSETSDATTVDHSTREQAEKQKSESKEEEGSKVDEMEDCEVEEAVDEKVEEVEGKTLDSSEILVRENQPKKKRDLKSDQDCEGVEEMEVDVAGEIVSTLGMQRPADSTIETRFDLLEEWAREKRQVDGEGSMKRDLIQKAQSSLTAEGESEALTQWHEIDGKTLHLAQELCEQLRLVLEPSQAARLKGDYKTGKRLNMRKVIPYIASGFRKDKIWLRRTQPSKREYQILLALDDSASMADNQSKRMALSAVAVVARSLSLLEAGSLGVVSFGEDVSLVHGFDEPFTDLSGASLVSRFTFAQRATRVAKLLMFAETVFDQSKLSQSSNLSPEVAQLLLIVSDGRGVSHEGAGIVKRAVRRAREQNIFIVFIVVDNPENKDSILDIRLPIFGKDGSSLEIAKYMDHFPFPFYLILRDLSSLPSVLSDALRQWFELVTSSER